MADLEPGVAVTLLRRPLSHGWLPVALAAFLCGCLVPTPEDSSSGGGSAGPAIAGSLEGWRYGMGDELPIAALPKQTLNAKTIEELASGMRDAVRAAGCTPRQGADPAEAVLMLKWDLRMCAQPSSRETQDRLALARASGHEATVYAQARLEAQGETRRLLDALNATSPGSIGELEAVAWLWREAHGVYHRTISEHHDEAWFALQNATQQWMTYYEHVQDTEYAPLLRAAVAALPAAGTCMPASDVFARAEIAVALASNRSSAEAALYGLDLGYTWDERDAMPWYLEMAEQLGGPVPAAVVLSEASQRLAFWDHLRIGLVPSQAEGQSLVDTYLDQVDGFWAPDALDAARQGAANQRSPWHDAWPEGVGPPPQALVELAVLQHLKPPFVNWDCSND